MNRIFITLAFLLTAFTLQAQQTFHLCQGFQYKTVTTNGDLTFSSDQKSIVIDDQSYKLSDIDSITIAEPMFKEVKIEYNGSSAKVTIPSYVKGVTSSGSGSNVVLTSTNTTDEILYTVSGSSENGSLVINGEYKLSLQLAGVSLTSTSTKAPVNVNCGKRIAVILKDNTVNTLTDSKLNANKGAFYIDGHPEFEGSGTLNVTGNAKHAICAGEYLQLKKSTGIINVLGAVSDGIHCGKGKKDNANNYFQMNGGVVTIANTGSDCIDSDDYGCAIIKGGTLNLSVSQKDGTGIKVDSILTMTGGEINLDVSGDISNGIRYCYNASLEGGTIKATVSGNGSRGIKAKKTTKLADTVLNGGNVTFAGTDVEMTISGGTYSADNSQCAGIYIDNNFTQTAGTIQLTKTNANALGLYVKGQKNTSGGSLIEK